MKKIGYGVLILSTLAFNVWAMGELSFKKELSVSQNRADKIFIDVGSGSLYVKGDDVEEVVVNAKIYSKEYNNLDELHDVFFEKVIFSLEEKGSTIVLKAMNKKRFFGNHNTNISIDLEVIVPRSMNVEIDDGSGSMHISNLEGTLEIDDGSGSTYIDNIGSKVSIDDGSGHLEISNIRSNVHIDDGSGKIVMKNIGGDVYIDDGSGEVDIVGVTGDMKIDDGSGSINVTELAGNFVLVNGGSGHIYVNNKKWHDD